RTARELFPAALDVVPGACTVLIDGVQPGNAMDTLRVASPAGTDAWKRPLIEVPIEYDGQDLAAVANLWGCAVTDVIRRHRETEFSVAFCGFAPGFAYL